MDSRYAGALRAFISHNPSEAPIDPAAPDPLRDRGNDATPEMKPRVRQAAAGQSTGAELLPLIFAQLPMQPTYRLRPRAPSSPMRPPMSGR